MGDAAVRSRGYVVVGVAVALGLLIGGGLWSRLDGGDDSRLVEGLETLPAATQTVSWTDWAAVRAEVAPEIDGSADPKARSAFLDAGYERDVVATSLLADSDQAVHDTFGWSVLDSEWEIYGQSAAGSVEVLRMVEGFDFDAVDARLTALGYAQPDEGGVRRGGTDLVAQTDAGFTPQLAHVALVPDAHLIVTSDAASYAALTVQVVSGDEESLRDDERAAEAVATVEATPLAATVLVGSQACAVAGFADASGQTRQLVEQRLAEAGGVSRYDALVLALAADRMLTVAMRFESPQQAEADLDARRALTTGAAVGQGGTFDERFLVGASRVDGTVLSLQLEPVEDDARLLSDLGRGSFLPAAC